MDNWEKYQSLNTEKLIEEIESLNKKLFKLKPGTTMYTQINNMLSEAESAYRDKLEIARYKNDDSPDILEIGTIESETYTPDYSNENVVDLVARSYIKDLKGDVK